MNIQQNPYNASRPISRRNDFFGRKGEFRRAYQMLLSVESINIIGSRRIGKTSFLNVLSNQEMQQNFLEDVETFRQRSLFVFLDMQSQKMATPFEFLSRLAEQISAGGGNFHPQIQSYYDFEKILAQLANEDKQLFIVLDEFESVASNEHFTVAFYDMLRHYQQRYFVSYVVASAKGVKEVAKSAVTSSEFFNIFRVLRVGLLNDEDANDLICKDASLAVDVPFVKLIAGRHPFFISLLCFHLFDAQAYEADTPPGKSRERIIHRFLEEAFDHFVYAWDHLSSNERDVLKRIANNEKIDDDDTPELLSLEQKALLAEQKGKHVIFSSAFEGFVKELEFSKTKEEVSQFISKNTRAIVSIGKYCIDQAVTALKK
ncbi:metallophosphoesterase [Candidatus Moduliflexus flocculans]|uniref:Metallophosphoesterase n=1 Tax=Candidatus Moduliflexus flocculans TaxID=1499966 RepID=A0A0S6VS69_9BACT|nr:metallophosphoesterase [Candidatus Moduliflexus flocculans]